MSVERKNPLRRDQALNDATSGHIGEEPRSIMDQTSNLKNERMKLLAKCLEIYNNQLQLLLKVCQVHLED